jgi:hypothetical protein
MEIRLGSGGVGVGKRGIVFIFVSFVDSQISSVLLLKEDCDR